MTGFSSALALPNDRPEPRIIAVGGGKGGVGKTILTANLAIALAQSGRRVAVVDVDLGGANLHTVLGASYPTRTLTDFLERRVATLGEVEVETSVPNLSLVSAARPELGMANLKHASKLKLLRHIRDLDADYVLLDLGAGSAYDTLDFFLSAHQGLLVVAPTPTSVENTYHFIRAVLGRHLAGAAKDRSVALALREVQQGASGAALTPRELLARASGVSTAADRILATALAGLNWGLVINQARKARDRDLGPNMVRSCANYFGISLRYVGCLDEDESVWDSVQLKRPTLSAFPSSAFAKMVRGMAAGLMQGEEYHA